MPRTRMSATLPLGRATRTMTHLLIDNAPHLPVLTVQDALHLLEGLSQFTVETHRLGFVSVQIRDGIKEVYIMNIWNPKTQKKIAAAIAIVLVLAMIVPILSYLV